MSATGLCALALVAAACVPYRAAPIDAAASADRYRERRLDAAPVRAAIERELGRAVTPWPPSEWDLGLLTLAAFALNPRLDVARAHAAAAEAATGTARARPNPSVRIAPGHSDSPESPWIFGFELDVPIETAGRRAARVARARHLEDVARLALGSEAWSVRSAVRAALLDHLLASEARGVAGEREQVLEERVGLLRRQVDAGEIPRPELDAAAIDLSRAHLERAASDADVERTRTALAAAIGLPAAALDGVRFAWPGLDRVPAADPFAADATREAVLNRLDVRRALAEYEAADAALRLEVARQYPDVEIGPAYDYDEGHHKFSLGLTLPLPVLDRNRGPIAEADAKRRESGGRVLETQSRVIADTERALARFRAARAQLGLADEALKTFDATVAASARRALDAGESDRLRWNGVRLQRVALSAARLDTVRAAQEAVGALEDAVQRPIAAEAPR